MSAARPAAVSKAPAVSEAATARPGLGSRSTHAACVAGVEIRAIHLTGATACSAAMSRLRTSASTATHIPAVISFPTLSGLPKAWLGELPTAPTAFARLHHSHIPVRQRPHCGCGTPLPPSTRSGCLVHARVGCRGENEVTPPQQQAATLRPIGAPCTHCFRHGDPMHAQKGLTPSGFCPPSRPPNLRPGQGDSGQRSTTVSSDVPTRLRPDDEGAWRREKGREREPHVSISKQNCRCDSHT